MINVHSRKQKVNELKIHASVNQKRETKLKVNRSMEITNIRADINKRLKIHLKRPMKLTTGFMRR